MTHQRFWELDTLKGIAIIFVVIYHIIFDLTCFTSFDIDYDSLFWWFIGRTAASLFIFTAGISSSISIQRIHLKASSYTRIYFRAIKLFAIASTITLVTTMLFEEGAIVFGILHFLAIASIISIPFYRFGLYNLIVACYMFLSSFIVERICTSSSCLIWLGIRPLDFVTFDYFPLIPWFGVYLLGLSIGKQFYIQPRQLFYQQPNNSIISLFCFLGNNTLLIYLVHQPILFGFGYFLL